MRLARCFSTPRLPLECKAFACFTRGRRPVTYGRKEYYCPRATRPLEEPAKVPALRTALSSSSFPDVSKELPGDHRRRTRSEGPANRDRSAGARATEHAPPPARQDRPPPPRTGGAGCASVNHVLSPPLRPRGPGAPRSRRPCVMTHAVAKTWGRRRAVESVSFRICLALLLSVIQRGLSGPFVGPRAAARGGGRRAAPPEAEAGPGAELEAQPPHPGSSCSDGEPRGAFPERLYWGPGLVDLVSARGRSPRERRAEGLGGQGSL